MNEASGVQGRGVDGGQHTDADRLRARAIWLQGGPGMAPTRVLVSGGPEKLRAPRGAIRALSPTVFITDEATGARLLD